MPIEGSWNRFKAFFLTEALLNSSDTYNTFANESLWYVQYFFGRETIKQNGEKFYIVQKPESAGNSSWISLSLKTTAYFFSALIWVIPGTIARLLSFDSTETSSAVFADRIMSRPKTPKVQHPAPRSQLAAQQTSDSIFAKRIVAQTPPVIQESPRPASPSPARCIDLPEKKDSKLEGKKQHDTDKSTAAPEADLKKETAIVDPAALAARVENHAQILKEVEQATIFFAELNQRTNNSQKLKKWLKAEQTKPTYLQPFYFSRHLKGGFEKNPGKIERVIPPETLSRWQKGYEESSQKLKRLGLEAYLDENGSTLATPQNLDTELQKGIDLYRQFCTLKEKHAEWLENNQIVCLLFMTLYWHSLPEMGMSLDGDKLKLLGGFYSKCKRLLHELKLDAYLKEKLKTVSPGFYSLVHYLTEHLTQLHEQPSPALAKAAAPLAPTPVKQPGLKVSDVELKKLLILGAPILETIPGMTAILENDRLFQLHKFKLVTFINNDWKALLNILTNFLAMPYQTPEDKSNLVVSIELPKMLKVKNAHLYRAPFSEKYKTLIETLRPILEESVYAEWTKWYQQCQERLEKLTLTYYLNEEIPNQLQALEKDEIETTAQVFDQIIPFFKQFLKSENTATWLAREKRKETYCFPFFYSFDLQCKLKRLESRLNKTSLSKWKDLYAQARSKVEALNLRQYLDEFPPDLVNSLLAFSDPSRVGECLTRNLVAILDANEPTRGGQVIGTTRAAFSSYPLTAAQWTAIFNEPEKAPDLAKKMSTKTISFFEELDQLPDQQEKVEHWLKSKTASANFYPFFFTRFVRFSGPDLVERYKKVISANTIEKLETLHERACCKLLALGLISYFDEKPNAFEMMPITLDAQKVGLMNETLRSHLLFMNRFLPLKPKKATKFLATNEKEQIGKKINELIPKILHWEKFVDAQLLTELKNIFPQFIEKLHQLSSKAPPKK